MRCLLVSLVVVSLLCSCSPEKGFGESKEVSAGDYGSTWPLTVDSALLNCNEDFVLVQVVGHAFRIDGLTDPQHAHRKFLRLWGVFPDDGVGRPGASVRR